MSGKSKATKDRIDEIALKEFADKGYRDASLRSIVRKAGVTTGSFYWYYNSKEELFASLVGVHYDYAMQIHAKSAKHFLLYPKEEQVRHIFDGSFGYMQEMLEYMYQHKTEFRILICGSEGTRYGNLLHDLTEKELDLTHQIIQNLKEIGSSDRVESISSEMEQIITSGIYSELFEILVRDIPLEKARQCIRELNSFYIAGWSHIMNIPFPEIMNHKDELPATGQAD